MTPRITISIVNWNTRDALERCLAALTPDATLHGDIVVVDNASSDGSAEMVKALFPHVHLIENPRNVGFAGANNQAIGPAAAEYVLLLNPDIEVLPGAITGMVEFMERTPSAGAVAPALTGHDGLLQPHLYRRFPSIAQIVLSWTFLSLITHRIGPLRRRIIEHDIRGVAAVGVDQIPGAAMLIRRQALESVGLLDPGYFIWFEDVDWCYRARRAGYGIFVVPACRMRHEGGASFGRWTRQTRAFQFYRAFFRFLCKHRLHRLVRVALPVLTLDLLLKSAVIRLRRAAGLPFPVDVQTLGPTRRAMRDVVRRSRAGELVDFTNADVPVESPRAAPRPIVPMRSDGVDVIIVNWNGRRYLPTCLAALKRSTVPIRIVVVDNASTDESRAYVASHHPDVRLLALEENIGYAGGANAGLLATSGEYAVIMNPDVRLSRDHLEILRDRLDADDTIGAAQGKLYQIAPDDFVAERLPAQALLDSAGHEIRRSRMVVDRGQGRSDGADYSVPASVFSACGAALFLRRAMLEDVAPDGEYFAESFFAYKEDIDLGWRARSLGWDVQYIPDATAHHVRAVPLSSSAWKRMPLAARRHSWKNHYLLIIRNDRIGDVLRALPFVAAWELARLAHALLRDPRVLVAYVDVARELRGALRARGDLQRRRRAPAEEMRRWFGADAIRRPRVLPASRAVTA